MLLSVELCSLTVQRDDVSMANLVASGLFGDGAAAVVAVGARRGAGRTPAAGRGARPRSQLYPDTERTMGWDVGATGLRIVLDAERARPGRAATSATTSTAFLADHGLTRDDIGCWVCHPGGPKVLEAIERRARPARRRAGADLGRRWPRSATCPRPRCCTCSRDTLRDRPPRPGAYGLLLAMGPGFCSELVLLRLVGPRMTSLRSFTVAGRPGRASSGSPSWSSPSATPRWSLARGGRETGRGHYPVDGRAAHRPAGRRAGRGVASPTGRSCRALGWPMLAARARRAGAALVVHRARSGRRWNTRVIVVPGLPLVRAGPYRLPAPPQLRRRGRRGRRAAAGARRLGHRAGLHGRSTPCC